MYSKKNKKNKEDECVSISISNKEQIASINNINGDSEYCGTTITTNTGSHLLKIAIKFITEYKDKFNVKKIQLSDHAVKTCPDVKKRIELSEFLMLLTGDTWYGRNGFTPQLEKDLIFYNNNKQIMKTVKVSDIYTIDETSIIDELRKDKIDEKLINIFNKLFIYSIKHKKSLKKFLTTLFDKKHFNTRCVLFDVIRNNIINKLIILYNYNNDKIKIYEKII